jgi:hypothetical protein
MNKPFIRYTDPVVTLDIDDWHDADGARLKPDGNVTPVMDLRAIHVEIQWAEAEGGGSKSSTSES